MINKPYIYRYRQALEQNLPNPKTEENISIKEDAFQKESAPNENAETLPAAVDELSKNMKEEVIKDTSGSSVIPGFEQIGTGIYQFKKAPYDKKEYKVPPEILSLYPQQGQAQTFKTAEMGYKRVDGLPGPFQNYSTPVYQFT